MHGITEEQKLQFEIEQAEWNQELVDAGTHRWIADGYVEPIEEDEDELEGDDIPF